MKAQDYANKILNEPHADGKAQDVLNAVRDLVNDAWTAARKMKQASMVSKMREALSKWKAVVRIVLDADADHPIAVCYFGLYLALANSELYEYMVKQNVFLGYEFSPKEESILAEMKAERAIKVAVDSRLIATVMFLNKLKPRPL